MNGNTIGGGITIVSLLGLAFVILKLCKVITWPWLWVLAPFWIPAAIFGAALVVGPLVILVAVWHRARKGATRK